MTAEEIAYFFAVCILFPLSVATLALGIGGLLLAFTILKGS